MKIPHAFKEEGEIKKRRRIIFALFTVTYSKFSLVFAQKTFELSCSMHFYPLFCLKTEK